MKIEHGSKASKPEYLLVRQSSHRIQLTNPESSEPRPGEQVGNKGPSFEFEMTLIINCGPHSHDLGDQVGADAGEESRYVLALQYYVLITQKTKIFPTLHQVRT